MVYFYAPPSEYENFSRTTYDFRFSLDSAHPHTTLPEMKISHEQFGLQIRFNLLLRVNVEPHLKGASLAFQTAKKTLSLNSETRQLKLEK